MPRPEPVLDPTGATFGATVPAAKSFLQCKHGPSMQAVQRQLESDQCARVCVRMMSPCTCSSWGYVLSTRTYSSANTRCSSAYHPTDCATCDASLTDLRPYLRKRASLGPLANLGNERWERCLFLTLSFHLLQSSTLIQRSNPGRRTASMRIDNFL